MFSGQYHHSIDSKGRLILPSKLRDELREGVMVTVWPGPCLLLIPKIEWSRWEEKLQVLPSGKEKSLKFMRFFYAHLQEEMLDKQGRIFISPALRKWARLEREVVVIGMGNRLEIWNKDLWAKYEDEAAPAYPEVIEELEL